MTTTLDPRPLKVPESDYCQRWDDRKMSWRHRSEGGFDSSLYEAVPIPEAQARRFTLRHHYSGSYPAARLAFGLLSRDVLADEDPIEIGGRALVGVAVLSVPMSTAVLTNVFPGLEPFTESLELGRFVLTDTPANAESWFLARAWELAADAGLRGVVSFADPMPRDREVTVVGQDGEIRIEREQLTPGHVGIIYQATNAVALGRSTVRTLLYSPRHGVTLSQRTLQKIRGREPGAEGAERSLVTMGARPRSTSENPTRWLSDALDDVGAVRVRHPGNFRYAWALGARSSRRGVRIAMQRTHYPKATTDLAAPILTEGGHS